MSEVKFYEECVLVNKLSNVSTEFDGKFPTRNSHVLVLQHISQRLPNVSKTSFFTAAQ